MKTKNYYYLFITAVISLFTHNRLHSQGCTSITVSASSTAVCAGQSSTLTASGVNGTQFTWSNGNSGAILIVSPTITTSYWVTGKKGTCIDTKTITVTVENSPAISVNSGAICSGQTFTMLPSGAVTYTFSSGSAVVSPTATTAYYVTGSSALGCISTSAAVSNVTVNALPIITVNSGSICEWGAFVMNPSGAATYTFSSGSATVFPNSSTSYSVTGTSAEGCSSALPAISNVTVHPAPVISVNSGTICSGQSFTMVPSGAFTYTFSSGSAIVSPTTSSSYSVTGTSDQGCVSSTSPAISNVSVNDPPFISVNSGAICSGQSFTMVPSGAETYTFSSGSPVVSPTVNTSYSVNGTSADGCVSSSPAISNVTVNSLPVISVNSGSICSGQSFTMIPAGAETYTFSGGSSVVSPIATTSYSVNGTSAEGCVSSSPAISNVTVNSLPVISVNSGSICSGQSFTMIPSGAETYTFSSGSAVVSPTVNTSYSVSGTSAEGCVSSSPAISDVTVNTLPVISVNSGSICSGESFTIIPSGASTYTFSGGSAVVSPTTTTSYSVTGTSAEGCVSSLPAISNVTVYTAPIVYCGPDQTLYYGYGPVQCATLSGSAWGAPGPYQYSWSNGGVTQSISVCPTVTTVYDLTVSANGCYGNGQITVNVLDVNCGNNGNKVVVCHNGHTICIAAAAVPAHLAHGDILGPCLYQSKMIPGEPEAEVEEVNEVQRTLSVYPNPNAGSFVIEFGKKETTKQLKIEVKNVIGKVVNYKIQELNDDSFIKYVELDKSLPAGIYFLYLTVGKEVHVTKMILER